MGNANSAPSATPNIKHFSHPHDLEQAGFWFLQCNKNKDCSCCKTPPLDEQTYICRPCNFFLRGSCSKFPQVIPTTPTSATPPPSSPSPPIPAAQSVTTAAKAVDLCDICRDSIESNEWHYRCNVCDFDVRLHCTAACPAQRMVHGGKAQLLLLQHPQIPGGILINDQKQMAGSLVPQRTNTDSSMVIGGGSNNTAQFLQPHMLW
ncbi:hypothetical protein ACH5RR_025232 [Cinchona calisaya]|uniref:DC1 domain-containing protein n=1 Tax=Cinchona calisaya TaxID=153742 RepID=A0ABD2Z2F4_9GENT